MHTLLWCVHSHFICILSIPLTWSLDASFSKISMSHSMISTALFYKWNNEHIKIILVFASRGSLQFILHILWDFKPFQANVLMPFLIQIQNYKTLFSFLEPGQWVTRLPCRFLSWRFLKSIVWTGLGSFWFFLYWKTEEETNSMSEISHHTRHVLVQMEFHQTSYKSIFLLSSADYFIPTKNSGLFQYVKRVSSSYKIMKKKISLWPFIF